MGNDPSSRLVEKNGSPCSSGEHFTPRRRSWGGSARSFNVTVESSSPGHKKRAIPSGQLRSPQVMHLQLDSGTDNELLEKPDCPSNITAEQHCVSGKESAVSMAQRPSPTSMYSVTGVAARLRSFSVPSINLHAPHSPVAQGWTRFEADSADNNLHALV